MIDTQVQLDQTINQEFLPVKINETSNPSLVVFTGDKTWRIDLDDLDHATIGRDESCVVSIELQMCPVSMLKFRERGMPLSSRILAAPTALWFAARKSNNIF